MFGRLAECEFFFGGEDEAVTADEGEVEEAKSIPGGGGFDTDAVDWVLKLED